MVIPKNSIYKVQIQTYFVQHSKKLCRKELVNRFLFKGHALGFHLQTQ